MLRHLTLDRIVLFPELGDGRGGEKKTLKRDFIQFTFLSAGAISARSASLTKLLNMPTRRY